MKIHVITDEKGRIVATAQSVAGSQGNLPTAQPRPLPGHKLHHIELPKELEGLRDAEQLHQRLKGHLKA